MTFVQRVKRKLFPTREIIEGYENRELVETIFLKTIRYNPDGDWPLVAGLNTVLDFGGGAGQHYKLARQQSPDNPLGSGRDAGNGAARQGAGQ